MIKNMEKASTGKSNFLVKHREGMTVEISRDQANEGSP
jgi:hypothetical protein